MCLAYDSTWLINTGNFTLREVLDPGENHPYAILSHTWDEVEDDCLHREVTFQDMRDLDMARRKTGWSKIAKTCELAQNINPSLEWAWIDTCSIDKYSSAELTEAINSMFRWYREANVCFVYLSDLPQSPMGNRKAEQPKFTYAAFTQGVVGSLEDGHSKSLLLLRKSSFTTGVGQ